MGEVPEYLYLIGVCDLFVDLPLLVKIIQCQIFENKLFMMLDIILFQMTYLSGRGKYIHIKNSGTEEKLEWDNTLLGNRLGIDNGLVKSYIQKKSVMSSINNYCSQKSSRNITNPLFQINHLIPDKNINTYSRLKKSQSLPLLKRASIASNPESSPKSPKLIPIAKHEFQRIDQQEIAYLVKQTEKKQNKLIAVILMKKYGLRNKIFHRFIQISSKKKQEELNKDIKISFGELLKEDKYVYLFHLNKEPIGNLKQDIKQQQCVVIASQSPKLDISFQSIIQIFEYATQIEQIIKIERQRYRQSKTNNQETSAEIEEGGKTQYDWQRINKIKEFVQRIEVKPFITQNLPQKDYQLQNFLNEKFTQLPLNQTNQKKNVMFDIVSHYPTQNLKEKVLEKISHKIQKYPTIHNKHKYKNKSIEQLLQKIKRETIGQPQFKSVSSEYWMNGKQHLRLLQIKNKPLSTQNIPYIMIKYGITRAEAHNLYIIYKSLEKISAMRMGKDSYEKVYSKGVDRQTFDVGMRNLQINPGQEILRNVTYFADYINWQQFIKIVSISLRKTPQEKLEAILNNLGKVKQGVITQFQVGILVGNSINKLFNQEEKELKQYFTQVVMKQLDPKGSGIIPLKVFKQRVLSHSEDKKDLISFLMLNI